MRGREGDITSYEQRLSPRSFISSSAYIKSFFKEEEEDETGGMKESVNWKASSISQKTIAKALLKDHLLCQWDAEKLKSSF